MPCILRIRFSTPPGAGGRLPSDGLAKCFSTGVAQPEDVASSDLQPVPGKAHDPFCGNGQEISHGRDITWTLRAKEAPQHIRESWVGTSWILEMTATGTRYGKPFQAQQLFLTSLRPTPEALLQLVRDPSSIEYRHWIRDTQLHEDAHRYRGNGAGVMATLRSAALNLLRLGGFQSIRAGMQAVMHDIRVLLAMAMRRPEPKTG